MASRRPPLFELLQQDDDQRPGRGSGGVLGSGPANGQTNGNPKGGTKGHAEGSVERKPTSVSKAATVDSLQDSPPEPTPQAAPKPKPKTPPQPPKQPKPRAEAAKPEPLPEAERQAGAADWSAMHPHRAVRVPMLWVYAAMCVFFAAVVGAWGIAYQLGKNDEKDRMAGWLAEGSKGPGSISDPLAEGATPQDERTAFTPVVERDPITRETQPDPVRPEVRRQDPAPTPPAPRIDVLIDARQPGNNYLKLASGMTQERAKGLAEHLTANGVAAMALNEGRQGFGLYTDFPVPSGQFRTMGEQRREHEARVLRLLGSAPSEVGGPYTPRDQLWMRFDG